MKVTKEDVKAILTDAYHNGFIEPSDSSDWGFDYTEENELWLISDGLTDMYKVPVMAFLHIDIINEAGKELNKEMGF